MRSSGLLAIGPDLLARRDVELDHRPARGARHPEAGCLRSIVATAGSRAWRSRPAAPAPPRAAPPRRRAESFSGAASQRDQLARALGDAASSPPPRRAPTRARGRGRRARRCAPRTAGRPASPGRRAAPAPARPGPGAACRRSRCASRRTPRAPARAGASSAGPPRPRRARRSSTAARSRRASRRRRPRRLGDTGAGGCRPPRSAKPGETRERCEEDDTGDAVRRRGGGASAGGGSRLRFGHRVRHVSSHGTCEGGRQVGRWHRSGGRRCAPGRRDAERQQLDVGGVEQELAQRAAGEQQLAERRAALLHGALERLDDLARQREARVLQHPAPGIAVARLRPRAPPRRARPGPEQEPSACAPRRRPTRPPASASAWPWSKTGSGTDTPANRLFCWLPATTNWSRT